MTHAVDAIDRTIVELLMKDGPMASADIACRLTQFDCVTYVAYSIGASDLSIQIVAPDNAGLYRFVTEVVANVAGVRKNTMVFRPLVLKDVYQWSIPNRSTWTDWAIRPHNFRRLPHDAQVAGPGSLLLKSVARPD